MKVAGETTIETKNILSRLRRVLTARSKDVVMLELVDLLRESFDHYTWVGVYLVQDSKLVLAAYDGDAVTEHTTIPIGKGICGSTAKSGETIIVPDVSKDPRYLMCFPSTRAEIVVPILGRKSVLGEIDIDSDKLAVFTLADKELLEGAAKRIALYLENPATTTPAASIGWETQG